MFKHIVVAVDASPSSDNAVAMAVELAKNCDSTLSLLHVIRDMQLPASLERMAEVEHIHGPRADVLRFVGEKILLAAEKTARDAGLKDVHKSVAVGDPANQIIDFTKTKDVDLIVIGTRGLGEIKGMLLGSVSRKVSNLTEINCLMVH